MNIVPTEIADVLILEPKVFGDDRGFFKETCNLQKFAQKNLPTSFVQDNHSGSSRGILRGLHYQIRHPQGKLVWAIVGSIFDIAVDLRRPSPTFGQWVAVELTAQNHRQLWIPPGFAHGFLVTSYWAEVVYKTTDIYAPEWERTILWNDETLNIPWPLDGKEPQLSEKDRKGQKFVDADVYEDF